jgi:hypothetical protein
LREAVKIKEPSSYHPRPAAPLALPRPAYDAGTAANRAGPGEIVPITRVSTGGSLFLAQHLAQEFFADDEQPTRWRERDSAYRRAGDAPIAQRLSLDV